MTVNSHGSLFCGVAVLYPHVELDLPDEPSMLVLTVGPESPSKYPCVPFLCVAIEPSDAKDIVREVLEERHGRESVLNILLKDITSHMQRVRSNGILQYAPVIGLFQDTALALMVDSDASTHKEALDFIVEVCLDEAQAE